jgi:hypothetical protein
MSQIGNDLRYYTEEFRTRYLLNFVFIHINKTGGSSVERALGLPFRHDTALEIRERIGERRWAKRFSFTIVRNPWDKVASHYHYRVQTDQTGLKGDPIGFNEWVELAYGERDPRYHDKPKMFLPQSDWVCDEQGRIIVDFIGRFESLPADFGTICERIGRRAELPHLKKSRQGSDYRKAYSDESAEIVARYFARDLENFGYTFDSPSGQGDAG